MALLDIQQKNDSLLCSCFLHPSMSELLNHRITIWKNVRCNGRGYNNRVGGVRFHLCSNRLQRALPAFHTLYCSRTKPEEATLKSVLLVIGHIEQEAA